MGKKKKNGRTTPKKKKSTQILLPFPEEMTEAEQYFFEEHSGESIANLANILMSPRTPKVRPFATLKAIALARQGNRMTVLEVIQDGRYQLDLDSLLEQLRNELSKEGLLKSEDLLGVTGVNPDVAMGPGTVLPFPTQDTPDDPTEEE